MSRIDDLIAKLCPDGVPYLPITDVADYVRGITYNKNNEQEDGPIRVLRANNITVSSNTLNFADVKRVSADVRVNERQRIRGGDILICAGSGSKEHIGKVAFIERNMSETFGGFMAVVRSLGDVQPRFLFHALTSSAFNEYLRSALSSTTINNLNAGIMRRFRIPVPPLEVQREIVRILDQFTQLEAELEAELEARRRQYEHYRNELMESCAPRHEWLPLGAVGLFERGSALQKKDLVDSGIPCFHYGQVYTYYGISATRTKSFVDPQFARGKRVLNPGDVFIATTSENVEDVGKAVAWLGDAPAVASSDAYIFRPRMDARFVAHFLASDSFHVQKSRFITGTKVKRLSGESLARIESPVPPIEKQREIADLLDKFDALVNDLSVGLPAELGTRRKQYEYYRDKLLTFKELAA